MAKAGKRNDKKNPAVADDDTAVQRRVALLRHKLTKAMDDRLMRDQIVRAIRAMMNDEK